MHHVALIGAGRMGQLHLASLLAMNNVTLRYVYDPAFTRAISPPTKIVDNLDVIFDDATTDACIIATPSTHHVELITRCARRGIHAFCEKPVSFNVDELHKLKGVVKNSGINVQIGFNRRFDPSYAALHAAVRDNTLGALHMIKIVNRDPTRPRLEFVKDSGGLFFDFNVHDFDMVRFITGDDIAEIYAVGNALIDPALRAYNDIDTAIITATMKRGTLVVIDASRETGYGYDQQLEVFGERGMLAARNQSPTEVSVRTRDGLLHDAIHHSFVERYHDSYRLELSNFFATIDRGEPSPTIDDALAAVKAAGAAATSLKENRLVSVAE